MGQRNSLSSSTTTTTTTTSTSALQPQYYSKSRSPLTSPRTSSSISNVNSNPLTKSGGISIGGSGQSCGGGGGGGVGGGSGGGSNQLSQTSETDHSYDTPRSKGKRKTKKLALTINCLKDSDSFSQKKLDKLFDKYKEPNEDYIGPSGVMSFIRDLDLVGGPTDAVLLVIAWHLRAKQMGIFTKEEFVGGLKDLGLDSIEKIKLKLDSFREELRDSQKMDEIYKFAFQFYKDEKDKKSIDLELVDSILQIVVPDKPHIEKFRKFLKKQKQYKVINMDQWINIYEFSCQVGPNFEEYEEDGAWPVLIDMFVEWVKQGHTGDTQEESHTS